MIGPPARVISTSYLLHWTNNIPLYLFAFIFATLWADIQSLMNILQIGEEPQMVFERAREEA